MKAETFSEGMHPGLVSRKPPVGGWRSSWERVLHWVSCTLLAATLWSHRSAPSTGKASHQALSLKRNGNGVQRLELDFGQRRVYLGLRENELRSGTGGDVRRGESGGWRIMDGAVGKAGRAP